MWNKKKKKKRKIGFKNRNKFSKQFSKRLAVRIYFRICDPHSSQCISQLASASESVDLGLRTPLRRFCPSYRGLHGSRRGAGEAKGWPVLPHLNVGAGFLVVVQHSTKVLRPKDPLTSVTWMSNICASRRRDFAAKHLVLLSSRVSSPRG